MFLSTNICYINDNSSYWKRQKPAEISVNEKEGDCTGRPPCRHTGGAGPRLVRIQELEQHYNRSLCHSTSHCLRLLRDTVSEINSYSLCMTQGARQSYHLHLQFKKFWGSDMPFPVTREVGAIIGSSIGTTGAGEKFSKGRRVHCAGQTGTTDARYTCQ